MVRTDHLHYLFQRGHDAVHDVVGVRSPQRKHSRYRAHGTVFKARGPDKNRKRTLSV